MDEDGRGRPLKRLLDKVAIGISKPHWWRDDDDDDDDMSTTMYFRKTIPMYSRDYPSNNLPA